MRIEFRIFENYESIAREMERMEVSPIAIPIMAPKFKHHCLLIKDLGSRAANILKQEMLSLGGEAALPRKVSEFYLGNVDCLISTTEKQLSRLLERIKDQPYKLSELCDLIKKYLDNISHIPQPIYFKNGSLTFEKTRIMGILNVTDDSFYDGGKYVNVDAAIKRAIQIENEGADIIDIGACSSRPGSKPVDEEIEIERLVSVISALSNRIKIPISVDTTRPNAARESLNVGASIINDISGLQDPKMVDVVKEFDCPSIVMHMRGVPETMQREIHYDDVVSDILKYFEERILTLNYNKIIIDPGIGFGKRLSDNLLIIKRLFEFKKFGMPILIGTSRKSFIGTILNKEPSDRLVGSLSSIVISVLNGANIVRVHDVKESIEAIKVAEAVKNAHH